MLVQLYFLIWLMRGSRIISRVHENDTLATHVMKILNSIQENIMFKQVTYPPLIALGLIAVSLIAFQT